MTRKLHISDDLALPLEVVTQKVAWLGVTGSGKTYGASKLAELLWDAGAQIVVLDPVGVWWGLRLEKDGKTPSDITIPIFGGLHGDVPLETTAGAVIANLVVDKAISVILDVSQFESDAQKARFATDFADRFFFRKKAAPSAVHLFIEEAQEFVPQNTMKGEERMLHSFTRLQKLGRNFGIGSSYITQRPQEVNKKALNMAQTLFVFRTTGTKEREAIEKWIKDKSLDQDIAGDLPKLKNGDAHVWSPEWLGISEVVRVAEKRTFNASATPEVGAVAKARTLAPIDLEKIRTDVAATIERAKATDPDELKKRIAQLERQLKVGKAHGQIVEVPARLREVWELNAADAARRESAGKIRELQARIDRLGKLFARAFKVNEEIAGELLIVSAKPVGTAPAVSETKMPGTTSKVTVTFTPPVRRLEPPPTRTTDCVSGPQQKMLDALLTLEELGLSPAPRNVIAVLTKQSPTSSGFEKNMSTLRSSGRITYPDSDSLELTYDGRKDANRTLVIESIDDLHKAWKDHVSGPQEKMLDVVIEAWPRGVERAELAERTNQSLTSSGFEKNLSTLRSLRVIDYPNSSSAIATRLLFPEQLA